MYLVRGGRGEFKWEDVRDSQHRENYLGHSLMAPVGRWQKNKDLSWYAKNDNSPAALSAAEARKEEIRKIKEAEQDALSKALGYEPVDRSGVNANMTPLGQKEVERAIKETAEGDEDAGAKGVGFGGFVGAGGMKVEERETLGGVGLEGLGREAPRERRGEGEGKRREKRRSPSRDRSRDRRHRRHTYEDDISHRRHKSRNRSRYRIREGSGDRHHRHTPRRARSRSYERRRDDDQPRRPRERSYSPDPHKRRRHSRDRDYDYRR